MRNSSVQNISRCLVLVSCTFLFIFFNLSRANAADFVWYETGKPITFIAPLKLPPVVYTALKMWQSDMQAVTGAMPHALENKRASLDAKIRFILYSKQLTAKVAALGRQTDSLSGKKDAFLIQVVNHQLFVVGSDPRGLAYGILELSRLAGVSPWIWWGDVTPDKKSSLTLPQHYLDFQSPSIAYRGIFINDEDWSLLPWSALKHRSTFTIGTIDAKPYTQIFIFCYV